MTKKLEWRNSCQYLAKQDTPTFIFVFILHAGQQETSQPEAGLLKYQRVEPDLQTSSLPSYSSTFFT